jgi:hypothetical protein
VPFVALGCRCVFAVSCRAVDTYKVVNWGLPVGIGVSNSSYLHLEAVGKASTTALPYCVANEIVAAEVGRRVRLPIPPCCVVVDGTGKAFFASLSFNLTGNALPPIIPANFAAAFGNAVADILVFDIFICNSDRHAGNLTADYAAPARFNVFDHSHAVLGGNPPVGSARLTAMQNALVIDGRVGGNRHCLIDLVTDDRAFDKMLRRIEGLDDYFITELVSDVSDYGLSAQEVTDLTAFLMARRALVRGLISNNKPAFTGIAQWSLL